MTENFVGPHGMVPSSEEPPRKGVDPLQVQLDYVQVMLEQAIRDAEKSALGQKVLMDSGNSIACGWWNAEVEHLRRLRYILREGITEY